VSKRIRPTIDDMVGSKRAPQKTRVAETGSERAGVAGLLMLCCSSSWLLLKCKVIKVC